MNRPRFEVADIIRSAGADFIARNRHWLRWTHLKVLLAIARGRHKEWHDNSPRHLCDHALPRFGLIIAVVNGYTQNPSAGA
jgi:hypothetical protein